MKLLPLLLSVVSLAAAQSSPVLTTLYRFGLQGGAHNPRAGIVPGNDGSIYGTTYYGGASKACPHGCGAVYRLTPPSAPGSDWIETVLHSFNGGSDGSGPDSGVVVDANGNIYGTTCCGGSAAHGTVYELTPPSSPGADWTHTILHHFNGADGALPYSALTLASGGVLYGTTEYGGTSKACAKRCGTVFSLTPPSAPGGDWTQTVIYNFTNSRRDGSNPIGGLIVDSNGVLYGTASSGKTTTSCVGCGTAFFLTPPSTPGDAWTEHLMHRFNFADGSRPLAQLAFGPNGVLYGTTNNGGTSTACNHGCGVVFQLTPPSAPAGAWTETVLHSFGGHANGGDGAQPWSAIATGANGILYGSTLNGGAGNCNYPGSPGCGSVYQLAPPTNPGDPWTETVLYSYTGGADGADPEGNLYIGPDGTLYGTTSVGGNSQRGTVFSIAVAQALMPAAMTLLSSQTSNLSTVPNASASTCGAGTHACRDDTPVIANF